MLALFRQAAIEISERLATFIIVTWISMLRPWATNAASLMGGILS